MVPSFIIQLEELPLNASGKVDRRLLPEPDWKRVDGCSYVAPKSELEASLITLWEDVLGVEGLGTEDDFFERGGIR